MSGCHVDSFEFDKGSSGTASADTGEQFQDGSRRPRTRSTERSKELESNGRQTEKGDEEEEECYCKQKHRLTTVD